MSDGHHATDGDGPLFLKQYGARRTGTNYLRALIRFNYAEADVVPLMHILGDKHSPPPPFDELWRQARDDADPAFSFVMGATRYAPPSNPSPDDPRQQEAVRRVAEPLARAFARNALGFLVSIKDPYAWVVSVARYEGWTSWTSREEPLAGHLADAFARLCAGYNACYAAWLALAARIPERCQVVRYEDVLADPAGTLGELDARFGLRRAGDALVDLPTEAELAVWDLDDARPTPIPFDRSYYRDRRYLARLPPPLADAVTRSIDWELVAPLGYAPAEVPA
jgi:hypothetical protein